MRKAVILAAALAIGSALAAWGVTSIGDQRAAAQGDACRDHPYDSALVAQAIEKAVDEKRSAARAAREEAWRQREQRGC